MSSKKKWKTSYDSGRKYRKDWEEEFTWVSQAMDGSDKAFCRYCRVDITPRISCLRSHEGTDKHKLKAPSKNLNSLSQMDAHVQKTAREREVEVTKENKEMDLDIAVFVACHTAIHTVDHLGQVVRKHGEGSSMGKLKLGRTKCSALIKRVIAPTLKEELKENIHGKRYVVMIDESTDVSIQKLLCITISYVHDSGVQYAFLGLFPVLETNAQSLYETLERGLEDFGLKIEDCIGFASDGASVMVGNNNSVWTRIKEKAPNCTQLKCICHSLALCIQHAFNKLPSNLGFLLKEIPNWFAHSDLRRQDFIKLFETMNTEHDSEQVVTQPKPFSKVSTTRWLVRGKVLYNLLLNWEELILYFTSAEIHAQQDCKFKARLLKEMMLDPVNKLLFHFAIPVVQEFERVNSLFQSAKMDPLVLNKELFLLYSSLKARIFHDDGSKKELRSCDYGCKFETECEKYIQNVKEDKQAAEIRINDTIFRCHSMLEEAFLQVEKRLPPSIKVFEGLKALNPQQVLNQVKRASFKDLPSKFLMDDNLSAIEEQYRRIYLVDWTVEPAFKNAAIPTDAELFWKGVKQTQGFKELADYALTCLVTPTSNASIERIFSLVTSTKTKFRNRMSPSTLDAIIRIKTHLFLKDHCCVDFRATDRMFQLCTTDIMYPTKETSSGASSSTTELTDDDGDDWLVMSEAQEDVSHAHSFF